MIRALMLASVLTFALNAVAQDTQQAPPAGGDTAAPAADSKMGDAAGKKEAKGKKKKGGKKDK